MELAEHLLTEMDRNQQRYCLENAIRLCDQVTNGYGFGEPYYIILDNDALNALQKPNIYPERYVALIILFRIIVKQGRDFRVLINPAIFYEFNGKILPQSETEFCNILDEITRTVSHTQVPAHTTGLSTFKQARSAIKSIEHDLKEIGAALIKIKERDWHIDCQRDSIIIPLSFIARENCPSVNIKYFSKFQTLRFLESVIESKIIHNKKMSHTLENTFVMRPRY